MTSANSTILLPNPDYVLLGQQDLQHACIAPDGVQTLPELFAYTARRYPQRPALSCSSDGTLSYSELAARVRQVSDILGEILAGRFPTTSSEGDPPVVGIWLERSTDLTVAILAATTSGSTWLPFDPDAPTDRVKACLDDSKAALLLCDDAHYDRTCVILQSIQTCNVVRFSDLTEGGEPHRQTSSATPRHIRPHDPAYLIYTSGSKSTFPDVPRKMTCLIVSLQY
jgi:acyl-CoA synthetase (AMP-forming)/AMP-acid ligase II